LHQTDIARKFGSERLPIHYRTTPPKWYGNPKIVERPRAAQQLIEAVD
jgi:hypothetical protein